MTRYENFMAIAHAYYDAYVAQAKCLNKKPLSYDDWLKTDKSEAPGFAKDDCQNNCQKQCRDRQGRFTKDNFDELKKVADQVAKERGPASSVKPIASDKPSVEEKFFVIDNGKVLEGEEAKKYFIEKGLIDEDPEDSDPRDDEHDDEEYAEALKQTRELFKNVFCRGISINDFL